MRKFLSVGAGNGDESRLRRALESVALDPDVYLDRAVDQALSGGERKRIELASIVAMEPKLVILDEPDSGIDMEALRSIFSLMATMKAQGVSHVVPLITDDECSAYGVDDLFNAYTQTGFVIRRLSILDQSVCSLAEMRALVQWLSDNLAEGAHIMIHCVGGLGRSGLVAACYLTSQGLEAEEAVQEVRCARSPRAVESATQEAFIRSFAHAGI